MCKQFYVSGWKISLIEQAEKIKSPYIKSPAINGLVQHDLKLN